ncbi:MAG: signal peptide peptidase SppA [Acidobacteriota bacterium]
MKTAAKVGLFLILGLVLLAAVGLGIWAFTQSSKGNVPKATVLEVNLAKAYPEQAPQDPIGSLFADDQMRFFKLLETLEAATQDDRVAGIVARVGSIGGIADVQEVRDAILAFRAAGKTAVAYTDTFGEFGPGNGAYFLASAFDEVYIQPSGDIGLTGLVLQSQFISGTLDKLEVDAQMDHRYEYKNAMNSLTETAFTEPHREALGALMESIFGQMLNGIAEARGMSDDELRATIDRGPFFGQEAVDAGLVDGLLYRDQVYDRAKEIAGEDAELLFFERYAQRAEDLYDKGDTVALIYGVGGIQRGDSATNPLTGASSLGGDSMARAIRAAIDDDDVRAILLRVDCPGGSYVASDSVWHETIRAKEAGKPVIVSMSNVAASGGYFIAMAADKIVAQPGTITGSIGVFAGKLVTSGMWGKVGITYDQVQTSANSTMYLATEDYTEAEWQRLQDALDRIYVDFTSKVAEGRGLPVERVQEIAKGRIWSGEDAIEIGLVDRLGGFQVALDLVREAIEVDADATLRLKEFPRQKTPFEMLFNQDEGPDNSEKAARAVMVSTLESLRPLARFAEQVGVLEEQRGVLMMPDVELITDF